jgi:hypothetical protein
VDRLCAHFAADHLDETAFERRLDRAFAAQTHAELMALEQDLPTLTAERETSIPVPAPRPAAAIDTTRPSRDRSTVGAIFASTKRTGDWTPPRNLTGITVFGELELDFRDATFATPEVDVMLCTILGEARVIVPPGVNVDSEGIAILGEIGSRPGRRVDPDAPTVRIGGVCLLGEVKVEERRPGESDKEARKRLKAEKKLLKAEKKANSAAR